MITTPSARRNDDDRIRLGFLTAALERHGEVNRIDADEANEHGTGIVIRVSRDVQLAGVKGSARSWASGLEPGSRVSIDVHNEDGELVATVIRSQEALQSLTHPRDRKWAGGAIPGAEVGRAQVG